MKNLILTAITSFAAVMLFAWVVSLDSVFELPFGVAVIGLAWIYYFGWANDWFESGQKKRSRHGTRP